MRSPSRFAACLVIATVSLGACSGDDASTENADPTTITASESEPVTTVALSPTASTPDSVSTTTLGSRDPSTVDDPSPASFPAGFPEDDVIFPTDYDLFSVEASSEQSFTVVIATPDDPDAVLADLIDRHRAAGWTVTEQSDGDGFVTGTATFDTADLRVAIVVEPAEAATAVTYEITER